VSEEITLDDDKSENKSDNVPQEILIKNNDDKEVSSSVDNLLPEEVTIDAENEIKGEANIKENGDKAEQVKADKKEHLMSNAMKEKNAEGTEKNSGVKNENAIKEVEIMIDEASKVEKVEIVASISTDDSKNDLKEVARPRPPRPGSCIVLMSTFGHSAEQKPEEEVALEASDDVTKEEVALEAADDATKEERAVAPARLVARKSTRPPRQPQRGSEEDFVLDESPRKRKFSETSPSLSKAAKMHGVMEEIEVIDDCDDDDDIEFLGEAPGKEAVSLLLASPEQACTLEEEAPGLLL
jgi:hypothetical protein